MHQESPVKMHKKQGKIDQNFSMKNSVKNGQKAMEIGLKYYA